VGMGIFIGFSYFIIHAYGISLGHSGIIYPFLGAWAANIVFIGASAYLFYKVRT
jgi:lipopolysaccharide export system permease protein